MRWHLVFTEVRERSIDIDYDGDDIDTLIESMSVGFTDRDITYSNVDAFEWEDDSIGV